MQLKSRLYLHPVHLRKASAQHFLGKNLHLRTTVVCRRDWFCKRITLFTRKAQCIVDLEIKTEQMMIVTKMFEFT